MLENLGELFAAGAVFIIDLMPRPVYLRRGPNIIAKVRGSEYGSYCVVTAGKVLRPQAAPEIVHRKTCRLASLSPQVVNPD